MDSLKMISPKFEIVPLRSMSDFLLGSARFKMPNINNMEKWIRRVTNNLLYYQTNYFFMSIFIFFIIGILHPIKLMQGLLSIIGLSANIILLMHVKSQMMKFNHILGIICILYLFQRFIIDALLIICFGILLSIFAICMHASLRLRNMKNKIVNKWYYMSKAESNVTLYEYGITTYQHNKNRRM